MVLKQHKVGFHCSFYFLDINIFLLVFSTQQAFHKFEDQLRIGDTDEQKRNCVRDSEAGLGPRGNSDPYALYPLPSGESAGPWNEGYGDNYNNSTAALPLVSNATRFQQPDLYEDKFENKSIQSEDYDT